MEVVGCPVAVAIERRARAFPPLAGLWNAEGQHARPQTTAARGGGGGGSPELDILRSLRSAPQRRGGAHGINRSLRASASSPRTAAASLCRWKRENVLCACDSEHGELLGRERVLDGRGDRGWRSTCAG